MVCSRPFYRYGQFIQKNPVPLLACWVVVLISLTVLMPFRAEKSDDVIDSWLPLNGQARVARDFANNIWDKPEAQNYTAKQPGLVGQLERLGYDPVDDGFFRNSRSYYHIFGADKSYGFKDGTCGASIETRAHYKEWYEFNLALWNLTFTVDGVDRAWSDVCTPSFANNAWFVKENLMNGGADANGNAIQSMFASSGVYTFSGFAGNADDYALPVLGPGDGEDLRFWSSMMAKFPDDSDASPNLHLQYHSGMIVGLTGGGLATQLDQIYTLMGAGGECATELDSESMCVYELAACNTIGAVCSQYNYIRNCKNYLKAVALSKGMATLGDQLVAAYFDGIPQVAASLNYQTLICSNIFFYAMVGDNDDLSYAQTCSPSDITICVKESITSLYGTLLSETFVRSLITTFDSYPTEANLNDTSLSDADWMDLLHNCDTINYLASSNGQYIRTTKYIESPVNIARRLMIEAGNCTFKHPDVEFVSRMFDLVAYPDALAAVENAVETQQAFGVVDTCSKVAKLVGATGTEGWLPKFAAAVGTGDTVTAGGYAALAMAAYGYNLADPTDQATISVGLVTACQGFMADGTLTASGAGLYTLYTTGTGRAAGTFAAWYRTAVWFECPDFTDEAITTAMGYADQITKTLTEEAEAFNERSELFKVGILDANSEEDAYGKLYGQNVIVLVVSLVVFLLFVVLANLHNKLVAALSTILIFFIPVAAMGLAWDPYTPSVLQFLPYLCLGIGVDDILVVLHHFRDEGTIPRAIHAAGAAITITSLVNLGCFVVLYLISEVPDFKVFTSTASIAIIFLYMNVMFGLLPILAITQAKFGANKGGGDIESEEDGAFEEHAGDDTDVRAEKAQEAYEWYQVKMGCCRNIFCLILLVLIFIGCGVLSFMKVEGYGFTKIDFGLRLSELVEDDPDNSFYRSLMIFERFPLYAGSCGANKASGSSTEFKGDVFDDYMPRFMEMMNDFNNQTTMSYHPSGWVSKMSDDGPQDYPYYTNQARTFPNLPSSFNYWHDNNKLCNTDLSVPETTIYIRPEIPEGEAECEVRGRTITGFVEDLYNVMDRYEDIGAYCAGNTVEVFERYITVEKTLWEGICGAAIIVFVVGIVIIQDLPAAIILTIVDMGTAFQLWGFFGFADLRINNFLAMCIMLGAAFTVQYSAHLNRRFVQSNAPSRWDRAVDALSCYFRPIMLGALTTGIAVSAALFMPAKYFRVYFLYSFWIMVIVGCFNGLFVQSALLVLVPLRFNDVPMFPDGSGSRGSESAGTGTNQVEMVK